MSIQPIVYHCHYNPTHKENHLLVKRLNFLPYCPVSYVTYPNVCKCNLLLGYSLQVTSAFRLPCSFLPFNLNVINLSINTILIILRKCRSVNTLKSCFNSFRYQAILIITAIRFVYTRIRWPRPTRYTYAVRASPTHD